MFAESPGFDCHTTCNTNAGETEAGETEFKVILDSVAGLEDSLSSMKPCLQNHATVNCEK